MIAVVIFNTGRPQYNLYKTILQKSPGPTLKSLELKRHLANIKRTETGIKRYRRNLQFGRADSEYGGQCQRPDMTSDDYNNAKTLFLSNLQQQTINRHEIERNTIMQAKSALCFDQQYQLDNGSRTKSKPNAVRVNLYLSEEVPFSIVIFTHCSWASVGSFG